MRTRFIIITWRHLDAFEVSLFKIHTEPPSSDSPQKEGRGQWNGCVQIRLGPQRQRTSQLVLRKVATMCTFGTFIALAQQQCTLPHKRPFQVLHAMHKRFKQHESEAGSREFQTRPGRRRLFDSALIMLYIQGTKTKLFSVRRPRRPCPPKSLTSKHRHRDSRRCT
jgi:hypothetical protein